MKLEASFRETMTGSYWLLDAPTKEKALTVAFEARASDLRDFVGGKGFGVAGTIDAEGLATGQDIEGTVVFRLLGEWRVPYCFAFSGDDGRRYELSGQKEWRGMAPVDSLTRLPATLRDDGGDEVARAMLRFDWRADYGKWMKSLRLRLAR